MLFKNLLLKSLIFSLNYFSYENNLQNKKILYHINV